jgi:hypothetical protein
MADSPITLLRAHARHAPWNARGLAAHVTALVDAAGVRPTNASARAAPSARSNRHFLQLVAIKIRQREGATLDAIKKEMGDATGDALERRVATSLAAALGATIETRRGGAVGEEDNPASWRRMPVADGVELHVRDNSPASRDEALVAMREAVRAALGREDIR